MNIPETYNQLDQWTTVMFLYNSALKAINTKIEILNNEFIHLYNYNPIEHIKSRLKTPESIVKKLKRGGHEVTILRASVLSARLVRIFTGSRR